MTDHVEKIKKLLRLARDKSANQAEAALALNHALRLIEQHKVDVSALDLDAPTEKLVREEIEMGARISLVKSLVSSIVQTYFNVRVVIQTTRGWGTSSKRVVFLGRESDVTIARYVFDFLVRAAGQSQKEWAADEKRARRRVTTNKKESFIRGWTYGVARMLNPRRPEALGDSRTALALAAQSRELDAYLDEQFPNATAAAERKERRKNENALMQGVAAGLLTKINKPLAGSAPEQLQLC